MSERKISIHRTYFLGSYKNIRIESGIDHIPQNIWTNPEAMDTLGNLLLIYVERDFRKYQELLKKVGELDLEDSLALLNDMRDETYREVQALLANGEENTEEKDG
jgi:hypothetical protein